MAETETSNSDAPLDKTPCQDVPKDGSGDASSVPQKTCCLAGITKLKDALKTKRLDLATAITRTATLIYSLVVICGGSSVYWKRALISNAFTSGIRLYQRTGGFARGLNKESFASILIEDSCHYLFYSGLFLMFGGGSFCLLPIVIFAAIHLANFTLQMMENFSGPAVRESGMGKYLQYLVNQTSVVLKIASTSEIILMGLIILQVFSGAVSLVTPFAYYRFLYFRYISKRNHYTRMAFYEMRAFAESIIASRGCPSLIARLVNFVIFSLCKLAPTPIPQQ